MTLQDMLKALDDLPITDLEKLQERINQRREHQTPLPHHSQQQLMDEINSILQDAEPVELIPGTMDVDKLSAVLDAMREGLTQQELNKIAEAMNEEYIEPESKLNG